MGLAANDASELHRAGLDWVGRIGDVELLQLARAPARDTEEPIVEREVAIGDERWNRAEVLEKRRQITISAVAPSRLRSTRSRG